MTDPNPSAERNADGAAGSGEGDHPTGQAGTNPEGSAERSLDTLPRWAADEIRNLRTEAGRHRTRARDAESERDTLRQRVTEQRRQEALSGLGEVLADASDVERFAAAEDLNGEDGLPDPERYRAAAGQLVTERPHLAKRTVPVRSVTDGTGGSGQPAPVSGVEAARERVRAAAGFDG